MPALLTAHNCANHVHLILGNNALAASRIAQSLTAGARPIVVVVPSSSESSSSSSPSQQQQLDEEVRIHPAVKARVDAGEATIHAGGAAFGERILFEVGREEVAGVVDAVFVTDHRGFDVSSISQTCRRARIPINVVDSPSLCSFSLLSVHTDGPLQIGVTTGGRGCRLASRIRRDVAAALPRGLGEACERLGALRKRIRQDDHDDDGGDDGGPEQSADFNKLVTSTPAHELQRTRRARWLAQVCEYWPLKRLASITDADIDALFSTDSGDVPSLSPLPSPTASESSSSFSQHGEKNDNGNNKKPGVLILAGTGPGDPGLLTLATYRAMLTADVILADKLVPSAILDLVPRRRRRRSTSTHNDENDACPRIHIARKFPGNADAAQNELLGLALAGVSSGQVVVRLKQGDPFVYGRGGEEFRFFDERGLGGRVRVIPGLSSALAGPLAARIPVTQRGVADQVVVCTGVCTGGRSGSVPGYEPGRTGVFLMALNRVGGLVGDLTGEGETKSDGNDDDGDDKRKKWPKETPCAVIERASCPDQRVIRTTLEHVAAAVEAEGSRPPGLLVVGRACEALWTRDEGDRRAWVVEEGFAGFGLEEEDGGVV